MDTIRARFPLFATTPVSVGCGALPAPRVTPPLAGRTWDVVLDQLGERGIAVRNLERVGLRRDPDDGAAVVPA